MFNGRHGQACSTVWAEAAHSGLAAMDEGERKWLQRQSQNKQFSDIEQSLAEASRMIEESRREVQRSHKLLRQQREQDARDDKADNVAILT